MKSFALVTALLVAATLAACGGDDEGISPGDAGVSVAYALDNDGEELLVNGNLLATGDGIRLCSALAESFPPQCGGSSLVVQGLNLDKVDALVTEGDVSWTDRPIQLLGVVSDGTLTVSENAP